MAPPTADYYCRKFQANTFDPSRCGSCLRPDHMHLSINSSPNTSQDDCQDWVCTTTSSDCVLKMIITISQMLKGLKKQWTNSLFMGAVHKEH